MKVLEFFHMFEPKKEIMDMKGQNKFIWKFLPIDWAWKVLKVA